MKKVGIIGAGKIGGSLLLRLAESGGFDLGASDIHPEQLRPYESVGVRTTSSNRELAEASDLVIAAVKPWDVAQVMEEISPSFETIARPSRASPQASPSNASRRACRKGRRSCA